jgi:hypothetical protein
MPANLRTLVLLSALAFLWGVSAAIDSQSAAMIAAPVQPACGPVASARPGPPGRCNRPGVAAGVPVLRAH